MKRLIVACATLALAPLALAGQEPTVAGPAGQEAGPTRAPIIAVIDIQRVTAQSTMGQQLRTQIQAVQQEIERQRVQKQTDLDARRQEVDSLRANLNRSVATLTADEAEERLRVIRTKERDIQAFFEDGQRELERLEAQAEQRALQLQAQFQESVSPLITEVAESLGVDILLDGQATVYITPEFDISDALIARMNEAGAASGS